VRATEGAFARRAIHRSADPSGAEYGERVDEHLHGLREQLDAAAANTDDAERAELNRLRTEVDLHANAGDHHRLAESLARGETRFESGHPKLADAIRRVLDALSSSGI
jgi:hypothetical protein